MTNYIVRVYRQEEEKPHQLVGIVEEVGVEGRKGFTNIDELWEIFTSAIKHVDHSKDAKKMKERVVNR